jgi:mono/diheme cytochrome c family protein
MRFALLAMLAMTGIAQADEPWPTFGNPFKFTEQGGEAIYRSVCAGCHMPNGHGASGAGTYPSLVDDSRLAGASYPIVVVLKGHKGMPAFGRTLTDRQIAAVVDYVRTHFGNRYADAVTDADVATER